MLQQQAEAWLQPGQLFMYLIIYLIAFSPYKHFPKG